MSHDHGEYLRAYDAYLRAYDKYLEAWNSWANQGQSQKGSRSGMLEPIKTVHGFKYVDRESHDEFEAIRRANGAFAYHYTNKDLIPIIFGRGELWQAKQDLYDGDPFNNK